MQFLLCTIGKQRFAIDARDVKKITTPVLISRLPYVPDYVEGLINVDGEVIAQINLPLLFKITANDERELIVLSANDFLMALVVSKVLEKVEVSEDNINTFSNQGDTNNVILIHSHQFDYIVSELIYQETSYLIINHEKLIELIKPKNFVAGEKSFLTSNKSKTLESEERKIQTLIFEVSTEVFALPLLSVQEIIEVPRCSRIPNSPDEVVGISSLRGQPLLILSASKIFNFTTDNDNSESTQELNKVIIVPHNGGAIGLLVDKLTGIKSFSLESQRIEESEKIFVVSYLVGQLLESKEQRVILLMSLEKLYASAHFNLIRPYIPNVKTIKEQKKITTIKLLKVVLANETCALPVEHIIRLIDYKNTTAIEDNKGIVGTVDVDGQIIPLLNMNKQLNIKNEETFEKLVVIDIKQQRWALCINDAQALIDLDIELIDKSSQRKAVNGIASYKGELISILDFEWLISSQ